MNKERKSKNPPLPKGKRVRRTTPKQIAPESDEEPAAGPTENPSSEPRKAAVDTTGTLSSEPEEPAVDLSETLASESEDSTVDTNETLSSEPEEPAVDLSEKPTAEESVAQPEQNSAENEISKLTTRAAVETFLADLLQKAQAAKAWYDDCYRVASAKHPEYFEDDQRLKRWKANKKKIFTIVGMKQGTRKDLQKKLKECNTYAWLRVTPDKKSIQFYVGEAVGTGGAYLRTTHRLKPCSFKEGSQEVFSHTTLAATEWKEWLLVGARVNDLTEQKLKVEVEAAISATKTPSGENFFSPIWCGTIATSTVLKCDKDPVPFNWNYCIAKIPSLL